MNKRPWYQYVLATAVLAVLAYIAYFSPKQSELKSIRADRVQVEDEVTKLKAQKRQVDKIQAQLGLLAKSMAEFEPLIPSKKETGEILRNIQQLAYDAQLDVVHFASDKETVKDFYSELPIPIEIVGSYHNLGLFLDRLSRFPRIFNIDDFNIRALPTQGPETTMSAVITAKTYFFLDIGQIKRPEKPKPVRPAKETNEGF